MLLSIIWLAFTVVFLALGVRHWRESRAAVPELGDTNWAARVIGMSTVTGTKEFVDQVNEFVKEFNARSSGANRLAACLLPPPARAFIRLLACPRHESGRPGAPHQTPAAARQRPRALLRLAAGSPPSRSRRAGPAVLRSGAASPLGREPLPGRGPFLLAALRAVRGEGWCVDSGTDVSGELHRGCTRAFQTSRGRTPPTSRAI